MPGFDGALMPVSPCLLTSDGSLLDETVDVAGSALDGSIPAVPCPPSLPPPVPMWSSSLLMGDGGTIRGVKLKRGLGGACAVNYVCAVCGVRMRIVNGTSDGNYCKMCLSSIFPFNQISSDRDFKEAINGFVIEGRHLRKAEKLKFNPLDEELKLTSADLDQTLGECKYYDEDQFIKMKQRFLVKNIGQFSLLKSRCPASQYDVTRTW